jgi:mRNA-degrading endonuclease RelE of RelBE toxin-antitoxin system
MFKGKPVRVVMTDNAKEAFEFLKDVVLEELRKGVTKSDNQILLRAINQKIELLRNNPEHGTHIQRDRIPYEYLMSYNANSLWKINLSGAWRMIYTIRGNEIEILALIIDLLSHRTYEKKFGYKKS